MIKTAKSAARLAAVFGFDPLKAARSVRALPAFISDYVELKKQRPINSEFVLGTYYPCLEDKSVASGSGSGHYFHQDLLVASRIFVAQPQRHIDVGSRIDGLVAHVAAFRKIVVLDIRPMNERIRNVEFIRADLMEDLPAGLIESCDSLSCLHALEHFGLGRYGDSIRWDGYRVGLDNMLAMLKIEGTFYLSVPIGPQRIEFNAHRVFSIGCLLELFSGRLQVDRFSFVDDRGHLHENVTLGQAEIDTNCGCSYGCGIFELTKVPTAKA